MFWGHEKVFILSPRNSLKSYLHTLNCKQLLLLSLQKGLKLIIYCTFVVKLKELNHEKHLPYCINLLLMKIILKILDYAYLSNEGVSSGYYISNKNNLKYCVKIPNSSWKLITYVYNLVFCLHLPLLCISSYIFFIIFMFIIFREKWTRKFQQDGIHDILLMKWWTSRKNFLFNIWPWNTSRQDLQFLYHQNYFTNYWRVYFSQQFSYTWQPENLY